MFESIGESIFWAVIQGFIVFAVVYLSWGLFSADTVDLGFVLRVALGWTLGAFIGQLFFRTMR